MTGATPTSRLLFVDDEASIRMTLPPVLEKAGFEVRVAESVSDALFEINSRQFEILISDLNIGEEGDGFLVTSAMRHVQPDCLTFILTGYPAFETALQAIHNHVDDYLVKPVDIESLTKTLQEKLRHRTTKLPFGALRLASVIKNEAGPILSRALAAQSNGKPASANEPEFKLFLNALIEQLELEHDRPSSAALRSAPVYAKKVFGTKFDPARLAAQFSALEQEVYRAVQNHLAGMDLTLVISDLKRFSGGLHSLLQASLDAYGKTGSKPAKRILRSSPTRRKPRPTR
jgi:ActR/RegA family two-component response regulator